MPEVRPYGTGAAETVLLVRRPAAEVWILYRQWFEPAYKWILYDWVRDGPRMLGICHSRHSDCRDRRCILYYWSGTGPVERSVRNSVFDTGSDIESGISGSYGFDLSVFLLLRMGRKGPWFLKKINPRSDMERGLSVSEKFEGPDVVSEEPVEEAMEYGVGKPGDKIE